MLPAATVGSAEVGGWFVFLVAGGRSDGQLLAWWELHGPVPQTPGSSPGEGEDGRGPPSAGAAGGTIGAGRAAVKRSVKYSRLVSRPVLTALKLQIIYEFLLCLWHPV